MATKGTTGKALNEARRRIEECQRSGSQELNLNGLGLTFLPESTRSLSHIRALTLQKNKLTSLPSSICALTNLTRLALSGNNNVMMPECLGTLRDLSELYLADLNLKSVPSFVRNLAKLESLSLEGNRLTSLPEWLRELPLVNLYLGANDLKVPLEILRTSDAAKILDYYFRTAAGAQPLNEFKLVLVGRGGVGKTSLVHRLVHHEYKTFDRTPGISITIWPLKIERHAVRAHVWDFGGQEIMHGTHRFFMTERAMYLVLLSGREGTEDHDAEYWLSLIRSFAGDDVPIIVLLHKYDDYPLELNRELLREKYGRRLAFLQTDSGTGYNIDALHDEICRLASSLPGLKAAWPAEWRRVKEDLPASRRNWLTFDDFQGFCRDRGVPDPKDQEALAESLHALGLMLSYQRHEMLRRVGVLNPQWVTEGIYQILNAPALRAANGQFTLKSFADILPADRYPESLHPYLLALMHKFRLCHPLDEKRTHYLIPELLTKEEPPALDKEFIPDECLGFVYFYPTVLPEGLLSRFIVDTYVHRGTKVAWRTGVVLERANCRALVRGDVQGRRITIRVSGVGNGRRELLGIVREHFERIHASYEKLPVTEFVPVPSHPEAEVRHELLLKYEFDGRDQIAVEIGKGLRDFDVKKLLDGVDFSRERAVKAIPVFISYAHEDSVYCDQLKGALTPYERKNELQIWADQLIDAGQTWETEIIANLDRAKIVILLLSNDFMRSDYAMEKEVPYALKRHERGECVVIPVVARPARWEKLFGSIQAVMPHGKPVSQAADKDAAWEEVTKQLDKVIARLTLG
jgi:internalin A